MATKDKKENLDDAKAEEKKQEALKKEQEQAKSEGNKAKEKETAELEALQKGDFKFIDSKSELEYLAKFMKSARMPDGLQMSTLDKQKSEAAAASWYAKAQKTLGAS